MRDLRPTSNKVKQALFNILYDISELSFLDLFSGTGEIGLTAIKKGANPVYFVEIERKRANDIKKRAKSISNNIKVYPVDALKFLKQNKTKFDVIFADPPYNYKSYDKLIKMALDSLSQDGIFILEHRINHSFNADKEKKYGDTILSIWYR